MCNQWFWAEDENGDNLPFDAILGLWVKVADGYSFVDQYEIGAAGLSLELQDGVGYKYKAILPVGYADDWERPADRSFTACRPDFTLVYERIIVDVPILAFSNIAVSRRYGSRLYLSGTIEDITESDDICVYYKRPGDTGVRNLKSDTSDYLHFSGASGSYDLGANNHYLEFERSGYHWLEIWNISGDCETPVLQRIAWLIDLSAPRFQYQVIFDLEDPDLGDKRYLLEAEYATFEAAGGWEITHEDPDCFPLIAGHGGGVDETPRAGWLSLGVEFGESGCWPLPWQMCPDLTPQTQYWRGECNCDHFLNTLQPLGIPCWHLIAAMKWYSGKPAWSEYSKCP